MVFNWSSKTWCCVAAWCCRKKTQNVVSGLDSSLQCSIYHVDNQTSQPTTNSWFSNFRFQKVPKNAWRWFWVFKIETCLQAIKQTSQAECFWSIAEKSKFGSGHQSYNELPLKFSKLSRQTIKHQERRKWGISQFWKAINREGFAKNTFRGKIG